MLAFRHTVWRVQKRKIQTQRDNRTDELKFKVKCGITYNINNPIRKSIKAYQEQNFSEQIPVCSELCQ